jgi:ATP-dependent protease ClpP protease subunit
MNHIKCQSDEEQQRKPAPYAYYESSMQSRVHHFYISEAVSAPIEYVDMIHTIKTAGPGDVIYLYLNMPGGRIDTGVQIINAMRASQGKVITSLEGESHSLGTLLFLSGDEFIVHDDCLMMFHNFSSGTFGKGNEQAAQIEATIKWFTKLAKGVYIPFLSEEEFDRIARGEDLWLDSEEIQERLKSMVEQFVAEREAEEDMMQHEEEQEILALADEIKKKQNKKTPTTKKKTPTKSAPKKSS